MSPTGSLRASIVLSLGGLLGVQLTFALAVGTGAGVPPASLLTFAGASTAFHAALTAFLLTQADLFRLVPSDEPLRRINIANRLTLFRLSSLPTIVLFLVLVRGYAVTVHLVVLTVVSFLTDLVDGAVARGAKQITRIGRYLDSICDYAILIIISGTMIGYGLVPRWFFALVMFRLLFQWAGMGALLLYQGFVRPETTWWGKVSVFAVMTVYAAELLRLFTEGPEWIDLFVGTLEWIGAVIVAVSVVDKAVFFRRAFREASRSRGASRTSRQGTPEDSAPN